MQVIFLTILIIIICIIVFHVIGKHLFPPQNLPRKRKAKNSQSRSNSSDNSNCGCGDYVDISNIGKCRKCPDCNCPEIPPCPQCPDCVCPGGSPCPECPDPKITICHFPPGNPNNPQTLSVAASSLPAHYSHGDILGACPT